MPVESMSPPGKNDNYLFSWTGHDRIGVLRSSDPHAHPTPAPLNQVLLQLLWLPVPNLHTLHLHLKLLESSGLLPYHSSERVKLKVNSQRLKRLHRRLFS